MRRTLIPILLLLLAACSGGNNAAGNKSSAGSGTPTGENTAGVNGDIQKLQAKAAAWDPDSGKLRICMATFAAPDEMMAAMANPRPEGDQAMATEPYVTLTIEFKDEAEVLDRSSIKQWVLEFDLFKEGPMIYQRMDSNEIKLLDFDPKAGTVKLILDLHDNFKVGSGTGTTYDCHISDTLTVKILEKQ